ncbi:hypothetical protein FB45DRAFT_745217 [Roridomyces roridus]|uniref:Ketoreductase domain-containing protein n=1 Tax=Roridomyces roridus TaxID=1738132 RepID=A0AAD7FR03_9AGAR|nr:hypothetical protein FB45DRAFT_745217 [Roridomyces roridus]
MSSYLVAGAARGIGLEFVNQLSAEPSNTVFALVRNKSTATHLAKLPGKNITVVEADIADPAALAAAATQVSAVTGGKLDYLIISAALLRMTGPSLTNPSSPEDLEKDLLETLKVNAVGPAHTTNAFLPLLRKGSAKKVVVLSSGAGDVDFVLKAGLGESVGYAVSKAALNMVVAKYAVQLKPEGFVFLALSPGVVNTFATSDAPPPPAELIQGMMKAFTSVDPNFKGPISPEDSVKMQLEVIHRWTIEDSGAFVSHHGNKDWF